GTLARRLIDGAKEVKVMGESVQVGAQVHTINGFSAHAGRDELLAWHRAAGEVKQTFLVHGDHNVMAKLAGGLEAQGVPEERIHLPEQGQAFEL
ncbi:MAG: MBL fold metallo-hydrolase RNA specificity domain-containing protein, partial [Candidatus Thermoplasmatota archaeon]|nr:MBL fold metallo-hydrolase RNA specificity domain-containing protein [Candidatus Thermoplasmatota archaeon]